ncbi:Putative transcriptional regulator%2C TetR family [Mycobacteroides abscessus]|nr:Putative transcriptional regulator%2C TetR family [Mycobacteroides abscessus]
MSSKRPGRRPGTSSARDDILASARKLFSLNGIDKTSIRAIASDAGVDPALVHHYFGTKLDLFREVVQLPVDPSVVLQPLRDVPVDELGVTIPRLIIALWDSELGANMLAVFRPALVHHYFGTKLDLFREVVQLPVDPSVVLQPLRDVPVDELGVTIPRLIIALWDSELGANMLAVFRSALTGADDGLVRVFFREVLVNIIAERVDSPPGSGVLRAEFAITQMAGILVGRYIMAIEPLASLTAEQIALTVGPNIQRYLTGALPSITP